MAWIIWAGSGDLPPYIWKAELRCSMRHELESRRQEALALVAAYAQLLKSRYGARRVIPFGSVLAEEAWHERSDIDLAVEGLSSEALWQAEKDLEAMVPPWLEVDLIPLEHAFPEVRSHILGERTRPESPYLALKGRLEDALLRLERITKGLQMALERAGRAPDEFAMRALACYVDDFSKGCERLCERVALALDGGLPRGKRWHQVLLGQMGEPGGRGRPPFLRGSLLLELDEYQRFGHGMRHIYGHELEAERVLTLGRGAASLLEQVKTSVAAFSRWLEEQAERSKEDGA
jgi:predicted nucleotidyltransferase